MSPKKCARRIPNKKVLNCAYGAYTLPPLKIDRLEPNVVVSIVGGRRPMNNRPEDQDEVRKLRESWLAKTDNPIIIFENYPFTDRGWYLPSFTPHAMGASINATKGLSQGEDIWLSVRQDFEKVGMGFNHFLIYFTQRMYWGGKDQDVDAMFREYCRLFYGPAEQEMLAFFESCEANWQEMEKDKAKADRALELFAQAQAKADAASVYGRRLAWMDDYLQGLRSKSRQLGQKRGPVPVLRLVGEARGPIVMDGKLDDDAWANGFPSATCRFRELQTGRQPIFGTTAQSAWIGNQPVLRHPLRRTSRREAQHRHDEEGRFRALVWRLRRGPARNRLAFVLPDRRQPLRCRGRSGPLRRPQCVVQLGLAGRGRHAHRRGPLDRRDADPGHPG